MNERVIIELSGDDLDLINDVFSEYVYGPEAQTENAYALWDRIRQARVDATPLDLGKPGTKLIPYEDKL